MIKRILVDADACPRNALRILEELRQKFRFELITVSSFNHLHERENHFVVGDESQAADLAIVNRVVPGDLVVTQDWGLAAMILSKKALAVSPKGYIFSEQNIDFMLEERHLKAVLRRKGKRTKGPVARSKEDDQRFQEVIRGFLKDA